jgi:hypothetical protein
MWIPWQQRPSVTILVKPCHPLLPECLAGQLNTIRGIHVQRYWYTAAGHLILYLKLMTRRAYETRRHFTGNTASHTSFIFNSKDSISYCCKFSSLL